MNIRGLDINEIGGLMLPYIVSYFSNCKLSALDEPIFVESYKLDFSELSHLIPDDYHSRYKDCWFNGASGYILFEQKADEHKGKLYTAMLISDEHYQKALFLWLQEENDNTHITKDILLADFLKNSSQLP